MPSAAALDAANPPYWLSKLADDVLEAIHGGRFFDSQEEVRRQARAHGLSPDAIAAAISREWDRIGFLTGERRALVQ